MSLVLDLSELNVETFEASGAEETNLASISFADCSQGPNCTVPCVWPTRPDPECS